MLQVPANVVAVMPCSRANVSLRPHGATPVGDLRPLGLRQTSSTSQITLAFADRPAATFPNMDDWDNEWQRQGATFSDKSARKEFGLTREEIVEAIRAGKLQYREASMHGNPWWRLLRREVEALVKTKRGGDYLQIQQAKTELAGIERELRRLKKQVVVLEARKAKLLADPGNRGVNPAAKGGRAR